MHYVAFSRATSLENLYILGDFDQTKIAVSPNVRNEMKRLRTKAVLSLCFKPLYMFGNGVLKIVFHNCQSLRLRIADIQTDYINNCDIYMLAETKLCEKDASSSLEIPDFDLFRNDFSKTRTSYGSATYSRKPVLTDIFSQKLQLD